MTETGQNSRQAGTTAEVFRTFLKLGLTSFGGPVAHLAYFRKELVERRHWVSESQYGQLIALCQFLPGPASSQLGFTLGLLRGGWAGALAAFLAFTLPSAIALIFFAALLPSLGGPIGSAGIHGLKIVACAVVADAVLGMSKKLCPDWHRRVIAILACALVLLLDSALAQVMVVVFGAIFGLAFCHGVSPTALGSFDIRYSKRTGLILFAVFLVLLLLLAVSSSQLGYLAIADAFYRAGALVFGGGHVVLPLLEDLVVSPGWVSPDDFLAGYGAAQAIPGPMFAFSAYLGAVIPLPGLSWLAALFALFFMFLPGFLLVSAALPLWQAIAAHPSAARAIAGVNAAIVGLLAAALYSPIFTSGITTWFDLVVGLAGFAMLAVWRLSPLWVVLWCVVSSVVVLPWFH